MEQQELNGTHQVLVYDDLILLSMNINTCLGCTISYGKDVDFKQKIIEKLKTLTVLQRE